MQEEIAILTDAPETFFRRELTQAKQQCRCSTSDVADTYVVSLLVEQVLPGPQLSETQNQSLTLLLADALCASGAERVDKLCSVGDSVLFLSGFFEERLSKIGVGEGYVHGLGVRAYGELSTSFHRRLMTHRRLTHSSRGGEAFPDLFAELADSFEAVVAVLRLMASTLKAKGSPTERHPLSLYEQWLESRGGLMPAPVALTTDGADRVLH